MTDRSVYRMIAWSIAAWVAVVQVSDAQADGFALVKNAASPYGVLPNPGLERYVVGVTIAGGKSFELKQLARDQQMADPDFEESADAAGVMRLVAVNPEYPKDLRDEISYQLLPLQLFFTVTAAEMDAELAALRQRASTTVEADGAHSRVTIRPAGSDALQAGIQPLAGGGRRLTRTLETSYWIAGDGVTVDRILNRTAYQDVGADGQPAGEGRMTTDDLRIDWEVVGGRSVPVLMVRSIDGVDLWEQRLRYREVDGHVLFDTRELDFFTGPKGLRSTAVASYGEYRLTPKR